MNNRAVQRPVRTRYEAVQAEDGPIWAPRTDGKQAVRVSERATVFDRPMPGLAPADPLDAIRDPIWNSKGGTVWTPDLVHCRLLLTGEVVRRLPGPLRRGYVSVLGNIALTEMSATRRAPLTPEEISIADWTLDEIMRRAHRQVLLASAFGYSGDKIAETMKAKGMRIGGSTVQGIYLAERRVMAGQWQQRSIAVDTLSFERWEQVFSRRRK